MEHQFVQSLCKDNYYILNNILNFNVVGCISFYAFILCLSFIGTAIPLQTKVINKKLTSI